MKKIILKVMIANAQGNVEEKLAKEQRVLNHSKLISTGFFVKKGSKVTVKLLKIERDLFGIFIGQWGKYKNLNDGKSISPQEYLINQLEQTITSDIEGMLYLTNKSETNDYEVSINAITEMEDSPFIANKVTDADLDNNIYSQFAEIILEDAIEVPTFIVDETTNEEFKQMLDANPHSPFVEIIGKHIFGTFQMDLAKKLWIDEDPKNYNINETFIRLDKIYELSNTVSGLNLDYDGIARKANNKMQIANPDDGAGYASATQYHIIFQQSTGAGL